MGDGKGGWEIDCLLSQSRGSGLLLLDEDPENLDRLFSWWPIAGVRLFDWWMLVQWERRCTCIY